MSDVRCTACTSSSASFGVPRASSSTPGNGRAFRAEMIVAFYPIYEAICEARVACACSTPATDRHRLQGYPAAHHNQVALLRTRCLLDDVRRRLP